MKGIIENSIGMRFIRIPAGEFVMGCDWGWDDEAPAHRVRITKSFYLAATPTTQGQWERLKGSYITPWRNCGILREDCVEGDAVAAAFVSWVEAAGFCTELTTCERAAGLIGDSERYRLPTEAEWECACRAGTETTWFFGDEEERLGDHAWYAGNAFYRKEPYAHEVGQKSPNPWGLFDMYGNVEEWCSDWYEEDYYTHSPLSDPSGPDAGDHKVLRGGSWDNVPAYCRSSYRGFASPDVDSDYGSWGFRLLLEAN